MLETEFGILFGQWLMKNKPDHSQIYEFKVTNGGTFNLKHWRNKQPHQPRSLKQASGNIGIYHKISDMSMGQKPVDSFFIRDTESLLVIWFDKWKEFFMIPIYEVPLTDSVSYKYCKANLDSKKLLPKKKLARYDF